MLSTIEISDFMTNELSDFYFAKESPFRHELDLVSMEVDYMRDITINEKILARNNELADENRQKLKTRGIFAINLISSPGSGLSGVLCQSALLAKNQHR